MTVQPGDPVPVINWSKGHDKRSVLGHGFIAPVTVIDHSGPRKTAQKAVGNGNPVDYRFLDMNPMFVNNLGCTASAIRGHTAKELFPNTEQYWIDIFGEVAKTGKSDSFQNYSRELDQWFNTFVFSPQKNQFASFFIDITEQKRAEEALHKNEALKNTMVSNISDVIVIIDKNGINQYKSPNITKLFGWTPEELVGKNTFNNVHPDDLEAVQVLFKS